MREVKLTDVQLKHLLSLIALDIGLNSHGLVYFEKSREIEVKLIEALG